MATIVKTPSGTWKAVVRRQGWPFTTKTFRTKRDARDWGTRTEDEMRSGVFIQRSSSRHLTFDAALDRYLIEVTPTKRPTTQRVERLKAVTLRKFFGKYALAAITTDLVARYRDERLATKSQRIARSTGKAEALRPATIRLELALLGHVFTTAIREWRIGLVQNPVANVRKPVADKGRDRRLDASEEARLRKAIETYSNPMLGWIFTIALETGMRSSEITGLRLRQVDVARRVARLAMTKNDSARTVPLTKRAAVALSEALANPLRPEDCDLVFFGEPGRKGSPPIPRTLTRRPMRPIRSVHVEAKKVQCGVQAWCA